MKVWNNIKIREHYQTTCSDKEEEKNKSTFSQSSFLCVKQNALTVSYCKLCLSVQLRAFQYYLIVLELIDTMLSVQHRHFMPSLITWQENRC